VLDTVSCKELFAADLGKTSIIVFSPRDRVMITYEPYVLYGTRSNDGGSKKTPGPNLRYWSLPDGRCLSEQVASKQVNFGICIPIQYP